MFKLLFAHYHIFAERIHIKLQKYHLNKAAKIIERVNPQDNFNRIEDVLCSLHLAACKFSNKRVDAHIDKVEKILSSIKE